MEELLTTEVLDREILEDARKKAFKILKTADDGIQTINRRWEKKTQRAVDEIRRSFEKRTADERDEIMARDPLDRRRLRLEISEKFLNEAMERFLENLGKEDAFFILERELRSCLAACTDVDFSKIEPEIYFGNMTENEARGILGRAFSNYKNKIDPGFTGWKFIPEQKNDSALPAIMVDAGNMRISVSVENAARQVMKDNRAELASALLGKGALND